MAGGWSHAAAVASSSTEEVEDGANGDEDVIDALGRIMDGNGLTDLAVAAAIVLVSLIVGRVIRSVVSRLLDNGPTDSLLGDLIGRLAGYVIVAFGLVYAMESLGIAIGPLLGALGVIGIALAFALQSLLENFVAGVLLQIRRPFNRGDEIQSVDYEGEVLSIDSRTMTIRTPDGETVRLPNAEVIKQPIVNLTALGRRRTMVEVGVAYGTDVARAAEVTREAVIATPGVLAEPEAVVQAIRFGESSIDLAVRYWHEPSIADMWATRHEVVAAVAAAYEREGISIPFPQRTVHFADEGVVVTRPEADQKAPRTER